MARWSRLLLVLLLIGAALHTARPLWNTDYFWHVSSGRLYLETGGLPEHDPFTYTAGENVWVHHEWLSQIVLAAVESAVGLGGSRLFRSALATSGLLLFFVLARRRVRQLGAGADTAGILAVAVLLAAMIGVLPNAGLRPHLVTWPLVIAVLAGVLPRLVSALSGIPSARAGSKPAPPQRLHASPALWTAALALSVLLWVQLHSSALVVPLLLGVAAGGAAVDRLIGRLDSWRQAFALALLTAIAGAVCLLQPSGLDLMRYALETPATNVRSEEWAPLLAASTWRGAPATLILGLLLTAATLAAGLDERRRRGALSSTFPSFWVAAACLALAFEHRRMAIFFFVPALYLANYLVRRDVLSRMSLSPIRPSLVRIARWIVVAAAFSWTLTKIPDAAQHEAIRKGLFPEAAAELLERADLEGRLFHDINWGGYLGYRRFPAQQVYADGRWLLAGPQVMADLPLLYLRQADPAEVEAAFDRYGVEVLVQPTGDLLRNPGVDPSRWSLAWTDPVATVLLRRGPHYDENQRRLCALYRQQPRLAEQARWPVDVHRDDGAPSPTDVPSIIARCTT